MKQSYTILLLLLSFHAHSQQAVKITDLEIPKPILGEQVIRHLAYTLSFNNTHKEANWVAYNLTADETKKVVSRSDKFSIDPDVSTGTADAEDYRGSGYDRGHLAPAANMEFSQASMEESFYYSNITPQVPAFNRGIWEKLEEQVRSWAVIYGSVYVVTGPVLRDGLPKIGHDGVSVPEMFYKVIMVYNGTGSRGIGFLMPNKGSQWPPNAFAVSIDSVEKVTGIDFFPLLPNDREEKIEKTYDKTAWRWESTSTKNYTNTTPGTKMTKTEGKVLICNSSGATTYHKSNCKGLSKCRSEIIEVTETEAKNMGKEPCKLCY